MPLAGLHYMSLLRFSQGGISLRFLQPRPRIYRQFGNDFVPSLSLIDVLMFNSPEEVGGMLREWDLVEKAEGVLLNGTNPKKLK